MIGSTSDNNFEEDSYLTIYLCIDLPDIYDKKAITKCIERFVYDKFLGTRYREIKFKIITNNFHSSTGVQDIIKKGLLCFCNMFNYLKLKDTNQIWFFYLTKGNVQDIYKNVNVILLNENPIERISKYTITKNSINTGSIMSSRDKTLMYKSLEQLFSSVQTINYSNITE